MSLRRRSLIPVLFPGIVACAVLHQARPVEARSILASNSLAEHFLSILPAPSSASFALQATAPANPSKGDPPLPDGKGKDLALRYCTTCHAANVWTKQHHTKDQWSSVIDSMVSKGLNAPDDDLDTITDYLATNFAPPKADAPTTPPDSSSH